MTRRAIAKTYQTPEPQDPAQGIIDTWLWIKDADGSRGYFYPFPYYPELAPGAKRDHSKADCFVYWPGNPTKIDAVVAVALGNSWELDASTLEHMPLETGLDLARQLAAQRAARLNEREIASLYPVVYAYFWEHESEPATYEAAPIEREEVTREQPKSTRTRFISAGITLDL